MQDLLNHYPVFFPKRNEQLYKLKDFLDEQTNDKYQLPIIVNITSLNSYGRSIKNILTKNTMLLLVNIHQLNSILAEYHRSIDGRHHTHRYRLALIQGKKTTKASGKFRSMKKLSKSLASLNTTNQIIISNDNLDDNDDLNIEDDITVKQRNLVKSLNEKRPTSIPLCRIPIEYQRYFELLNENDQSIEPYHKLTDLMINEQDINDPDKRTEKWPHAFFLRSSCPAYTEKSPNNDLLTDLNSQKNIIQLNDNMHLLQAGQILIILGDCIGIHTKIIDTEVKELQVPSSPSPSYFSSSWIRDKSRMFFSKKRRQSQQSEPISHEILPNKTYLKQSESYLKCQTQEGIIVYICLEESGLFSPLNLHIKSSMDISGVFQLKDLIENFRFPISVRHLDGSISFDNIYTPSIINRDESPTKLRLLMPYTEHVVYACPLNIFPSKSLKNSSPYIIIPLSVHADIEIQPCINMYDISRTEDFQKLIQICSELIEKYHHEISLIHFPLQLTNNIQKQRQRLYKKRSQSESFVEYFDDNNDLKSKFHHSDEQLNYFTDNSSSSISSPLRYHDSFETIKQKLSTDTEQPTIRRSGYYTKIKNNKQIRDSEDEIYQDVDKIYDYIRSGDITDDVERIQAKDRVYNNLYTTSVPSPHEKRSEQQLSAASHSPGTMITHRFSPNVIYSRSSDHNYDFLPEKNDGNVDEDQARALYLASKQRIKAPSQDLANPKPTTTMKRITKH